MADLVLKGVSKVFGGRNVVNNLNLTIREGEFLTLLGPSGCGKTTTLNMIAGLESITSGELWMAGKLYNDVPARKRNLGMVFQSYALFPHMTVDQNIAFGLKIRKKSRLEIFEKIDWSKNLVGLSEKGRHFPRELSGGERQRVALARALVLEPQVLLLDEPLSNLDQMLRETMTTELKKIHHQVGATMVYVTHNQMEALRMSDRIAVLQSGRLVQCDTPVNIFNRPANRFVASFIGSPAMNFFKGRIAAGDGEAAAVVEGVALKFEKRRGEQLTGENGREVVVGVRPQQIYYFKDREGKRHSDAEVDVVVQFVEPVGDRVMVNARWGAADMVFLMIPDRMPAGGEKIGVIIDGRNIHLYDPGTGERISTGE